ncbi:MAG: hypothetical protein AAF078_05980 [Planctomycetota bacterium]
MPVYLLTLHTYGSWLPDRAPGYVRRDRDGVLARDNGMSESYRTQMKGNSVLLTDSQRDTVVDVVRRSAAKTKVRLHACAVEPTLVHLLASRSDERTWERVRASLKRSLTLELNERYERKAWWSRGGSRRRVMGAEHFDELVERYLPAHSMCWREGDG